jgi:hypothetical protein
LAERQKKNSIKEETRSLIENSRYASSNNLTVHTASKMPIK